MTNSIFPEMLRDVLLAHHPIMRSETGPLSGCRCGQVGLGQDVIAHVVAQVIAALPSSPAEEAVKRIEALCDVADDQPDGYECGFIATHVLRDALNATSAPDASQIAAAQLLIKMLTKDGEPVDPELRAVAVTCEEGRHRCPEGVIADVGSQVDVVIQCGRDGGHEGNHIGTTDRGPAEWPRIEKAPQQWPDEMPPF